MADDFLAALLGNPVRTRLLRVFALNPTEVFTAPQVVKRSGAGLAVVLREMKTLEAMGIIRKGKVSIEVGKTGRKVTGKQKEQTWGWDTGSKQAAALSRFIHEVSPVQHKAILDTLKGSGRIATVILSGSFVGDPTRPADLIVAIDALNERRLDSAVRELEPKFGREIRYAVFSTPEFRYRMTIQDRLIRDTLDYPHLVLLDKTRLL